MPYFVGVDSGATRTRAGLYEGDILLGEVQGQGANPVLLGVERSADRLGRLLLDLAAPARLEKAVVALAVSGAGNPDTRDAVARAVSRLTGAAEVRCCGDLEPLVYANAGTGPVVLAIAGTGSSVRAQSETGKTWTVGGRGELFGDDGSAYQLAVMALRAAADAVDRAGPATTLAEALPRAAGVAAFAEMTHWARSATKPDVAALAPVVCEEAHAGDRQAQGCVTAQAQRLSQQILAAADALELSPDTPILLNGSLAGECASYRHALAAALASTRLEAEPVMAPLTGHRAALELARTRRLPVDLGVSVVRKGDVNPSCSQPPTEDLAEGPPLDALDAAGIVDAMSRANRVVPDAVHAVREPLTAAVEAAAQALMSGGRLVYIGAGTSGRLGVLDASECPPTFGVPPGRVTGVIAGGPEALIRSVEGAEDDESAAGDDLARLEPALGCRDVVVGLTASGATPYVKGGLAAAAARGAATVLVCCNPAPALTADIVVAMDTGPEVLAGSTRLKAGSATKEVLNILSTGAFALAGYVYQGRMVCMRPANAKLRQRAARIVSELAEVPLERAAALLNDAGFDIRAAVLMAAAGVDAEEARRMLDGAGGVLRRALEGGASKDSRG